ncbi:MAG: hypothetical protein J7L14_03610, partial [Candidatus Diapherotrites archaeon]|nr:hypothetical protein [Candidatus Diapherotrites archaeon]
SKIFELKAHKDKNLLFNIEPLPAAKGKKEFELRIHFSDAKGEHTIVKQYSIEVINTRPISWTIVGVILIVVIILLLIDLNIKKMKKKAKKGKAKKRSGKT